MKLKHNGILQSDMHICQNQNHHITKISEIFEQILANWEKLCYCVTPFTTPNNVRVTLGGGENIHPPCIHSSEQSLFFSQKSSIFWNAELMNKTDSKLLKQGEVV